MQAGPAAYHNNTLSVSYPVTVNMKVDRATGPEASDLDKIATIEDSLSEIAGNLKKQVDHE